VSGIFCYLLFFFHEMQHSSDAPLEIVSAIRTSVSDSDKTDDKRFRITKTMSVRTSTSDPDWDFQFYFP